MQNYQKIQGSRGRFFVQNIKVNKNACNLCCKRLRYRVKGRPAGRPVAPTGGQGKAHRAGHTRQQADSRAAPHRAAGPQTTFQVKPRAAKNLVW